MYFDSTKSNNGLRCSCGASCQSFKDCKIPGTIQVVPTTGSPCLWQRWPISLFYTLAATAPFPDHTGVHTVS